MIASGSAVHFRFVLQVELAVGQSMQHCSCIFDVDRLKLITPAVFSVVYMRDLVTSNVVMDAS